MVRQYGKAPYKIVLVHGGPGAIGSLKGFAQKLAELSQIGVVEALQSKYSIAELIEELYRQIKDNCSDKVTLVGHSWGAWLVALFAEKYPELIEHVILIGCGPLEEKYVPEIGVRRFQNLSEEDGAIFQRLIDNQATSEDMEKIPNIFEKSDNYCLENREEHRADKTDSEMHNKVWGEAAKLRASGKLLTSFKNIKSKLYLIQGQADPHPVKGVTIPLQENGVLCKTYVLEKCGHSPFMEKYAKDKFYKILMQIFNKSYMLPKFEMCIECYVDENRATPLLNPLDCLKNHTQYICGTCGRCICIEHDPKRGLQRWQFPFKSLEIAKLYLRTADYSMKKACGIYELKDENGRLSYKIFADSEGLRLYLQKNKGKTCKDRKPVFMMEEYREYENTQIRKLTSDEIQKYMSER